MIRLYRIARYILKHKERLQVELLLARDTLGHPVAESWTLSRLQGLFASIAKTRPKKR